MFTVGRAIAALTLWTVFGVLSALQVYVRDVRGAGGSIWAVFGIVYFYWAWAATTPLIFSVANRIGSAGRATWRRVAGALPVAALIMAIQSTLYAFFGAVEGELAAREIPVAAAKAAITHLPGNVLTLGTIIAAIVAFRYYQATQRRLLRAAELESTVATARLEMLRAQLQPHFLFNTLNLVSGLVAKGDATTANTAIARLGDLLRASLEGSAETLTPFSRELDLTRRYLEIARLRFGDRLTVHERIGEDVLTAAVPSMILQPLVENALQHGIARRAEGGTLWLEAESVGNGVARRLRMTVRDDGQGFANGSAPLKGVGLSNTRARLEQLYGSAATLVTNAGTPGRGASVIVEIPLSA